MARCTRVFFFFDDNDGIKCLHSGYGYFEVFGLTDDEFDGLKNWADYFVKRINK